MNNNSNHSYGDKVVATAMAEATGWLEAGEAKRAVNAGITALKRAAEELAKADFSTMKPEVAARTAAYLAKMVDEVARLIEFAGGRPDSRPELTVSAFLQELTAEELVVFEQVLVRLEAGAKEQVAGRLV